MTFLLWLRAAGDLAFYYSYAAFFVSLSGSAFSLPGILIPSFFYALSRIGRKSRTLRCTVALLGAAALLVPVLGLWDRIALVPAVAYAGYLARNDNYALSHDRQTDVFLLFCKSYPIFFAIIALMGGFRLLASYSLLPALLTVVVNVFLLRVLRHEPEIYTKPRFLLESLRTPAAFLFAAWLMHLDAVTTAVKTVLFALYQYVIVPLLWAVLYLFALIISLLVTPLMQLFSGAEVTSLDMESGIEGLADQAASDSTGESYPLILQALKILALLAVIAAVCTFLILFFRRLAGDRQTAAASDEPTQVSHRTVRPPAAEKEERLPVSPLHPVNQVRRQYRRYLKLCRSLGYTPNIFDTSRDICRESSGLFPGEASAAAQLRELYLRARYRGEATREDAVRASRLVDQLRSSLSH